MQIVIILTMKSIILASLMALAFAASPAFEHQFEPKTEYHYQFDGLVLSGLPTNQQTQSSQSRISAHARIQSIDDRHIHIQLSKIQMASSTKQQEDEKYPELRSLEQQEIPEEYKTLLELPVRAQLRNGLVSHIQFDGEDAEWSKNIKRSVLNMLSFVDQQPTQELESEDEQLQSFFTNEKTIEGDCQVAYTITKENEKKTIITKTVNFNKCDSRQQVVYGKQFSENVPQQEQEQWESFKPQTIYTYILDNELLTQVEVRSIYTHNVNGQEVMKTETRSVLTYEENHSINKQIRKVDGEEEELVYSNKWEKSVEEFFKNGDSSKKNPFDQLPTEKKMTMLKSILENINEEQNELETVHQLARIVKILRTCSMDELKTIYKQHFTTEETKIDSLIEQALAIAGTKNTIQHLLNHFEQHRNEDKFTILMKYIQETPYPSEKIADILVDAASKQRRNLLGGQAAWLAAGAVVRGVVSQNVQQNQLIRQDTRQIKQKYQKVFMNLFEQSETTYEKILALKTLGNAGIDLSVNEINTIINDHREQMIVRREAVDALRLLDNVMPLKLQRVLLPVYKNQRNAPELRMSALWRLIQTRPSQSVLVQIVSQMEKESNQQVQQFTYQLLKQFGKSTNPQYKQLSADCLAVLSFTRFTAQQFEKVQTTYAQLPLFARDLLSGVQADFTATFSKNDKFPIDVQTSLESIFGGNWNKYLVQFGFTQQNLQDLFRQAIRNLGSRYQTRGDRSIDRQMTNLKNLAEKLNIKARNYKSKTQEGFAMTYLRYKNIDSLVIPIREPTVRLFLKDLYSMGEYNAGYLTHNLVFTQSAYFYETIRKVPTTLGLPLIVTGKLPTVATIESRLNYLRRESKMIYEIRPSIAATHVYEMRLMTPLFEQGVKTLRSVQSYTPIDFTADLKTSRQQIEISTKINVPETESVSIQVSSRPVVFIRYPGTSRDEYVPSEERTLSNPQWEKKTENMEQNFNIYGLEITTRGNVLRQWNLQNALHIDQDFELVIKNQNKKAAEFTSTLVANYQRNVENFDFEFENLFEEEFDFEGESNEDRREALEKFVEPLKNTEVHKSNVVLTLRAPGNHKIELNWENILHHSFRALKSKLDVVVSNKQDWTLNHQLNILIPQYIDSMKEYEAEPHRELLLNNVVRWGLIKNTKKNQLKLNVQLGQSQSSRKYQQYIEKLSKASQWDRVFQLASLNQLDIVAEYKCDEQTQQQVKKLVDRLTWYLSQSWSASYEQQDNQENRIHLRSIVDPITRQYLNWSLQTPEQQIQFLNFERPKFELVSFNKMIHQKDNQVCTVSPKRIQTFDDMTYSAPLTTCWSVIAKDCSEQPTFAVLAKKESKKSNNIVVKFYNQEDVYVMSKSDDEFVIEKNGKLMSESQVMNDNEFTINGEQLIADFENIKIQFNGQRVQTKILDTSRISLCGLCGNNDNEIDNELRTADDNETEDIEEFHRSYLLRDDECEIEEDVVSNKNNYKQIRRILQEDHENWAEEYENEENRDEENNLIKKTEIKEFAHRICFSLEGVPACRPQYEEQQNVQQKVKFTCLPRHKSEARVLLNKSRQQNVLELNNYPVSFVESVTVPTQYFNYDCDVNRFLNALFQPNNAFEHPTVANVENKRCLEMTLQRIGTSSHQQNRFGATSSN
ncbi:unnamed protein product [Caenorhabditis angaria]|uniref:Vitellogenin domain-containing protein n=1 Tax=Caenorhabditis angaria TaxID=860376 RepID=A0A9P1NCB0_9PELO|nr:unnamed protein product [Caenorhabditis angaria]